MPPSEVRILHWIGGKTVWIYCLLTLIGLLSAPSLLGAVAVFRSSAGNTVTITTDNSFLNGDFLCLPAKRDPPTTYTFSVQAQAAAGWRVSGQPPASVTKDFSELRDLQNVVTVNFEKIRRTRAGETDGRDQVTAKVYVFWVDISLVTSGHLAPQEPEYDKRGLVADQVGTDALGILHPFYTRGLVCGAIQIVGLVNPRVDNQQFDCKRYILETGAKAYRDDVQVDFIAPGDDSQPSRVDGTPSETRRMYDADAPGYFPPNPLPGGLPAGTVVKFRGNFQQWFEFHEIVCSDKKTWHLERTARWTGSDWEDVGGNSIGEGWIPVAP